MLKNKNIKRLMRMLIKYIQRFGLITGIQIRLVFSFKKGIITISIPKIKYPIKIRAKTSDIPTFEQIFLNEEYNLPVDIKPRLIIDGGANVGYASIFFANKFPQAHIIAVEPEESNFKILKENTSHYQNIESIKSGIWNENTYLKIKDIGLGKWGFMVEKVKPKEQGSFKAITIEEILKNSSYKEIDILKLDIEGSEKEIFSNNYEGWLDKVNVLIIELHDRMKPGCSKAFYSTIKKYNFSITQKGENIILVKTLDL